MIHWFVAALFSQKLLNAKVYLKSSSWIVRKNPLVLSRILVGPRIHGRNLFKIHVMVYN